MPNNARAYALRAFLAAFFPARRAALLAAPGGRRLAALALLCFAALLCAPQSARPTCFTDVTTLYVPAPDDSQIHLIYNLLPPLWRKESLSALMPKAVPGRGGNYAWGKMPDSRGDGCFLAAVHLPALHLLALSRDRMYGMDDLAILYVFASIPNAIWVEEQSPFATLQDLADHIRKTEQDPKASCLIAGIGSYTDQHLANKQFERAIGAASVYLPVTGSAEAVAAVLNREALACWGYAMPSATMPGLRPLAVAANMRGSALPDVPTFAEAGFPMTSTVYFGVAMPASAPGNKREQVSGIIGRAMRDESLRQGLRALGADILLLSHDRLTAFLASAARDAELAVTEYPLIPADQTR